MEEVDNIILHFLRQLDIDIPEDIKGLTDLSADTIVSSVSKCLNTINPSLKAPKTLPPGISHRIEIAAHVATLCKDLGYKSEVGYQTFLYHNEADLRKVFMFLIECLPMEKDKQLTPVTPVDSCSILWVKIRKKIAEDLEAVWVPPCYKPDFNQKGDVRHDFTDKQCNEGMKQSINETRIMEMLKKVKEFEKTSQTSTLQIDESTKRKREETVCASETGQEILDVEPVKPVALEIELKHLKEEAIILRQKFNTLTIEKRNLDTELLQIQNATERANAEIKQFENVTVLMSELGVGTDEGLDKVFYKLRKELQNLHARSDDCTHRNLTLKGQIETAKRELTQSDSERTKRYKTIESLKVTAKELKEEYRNKEQSNLQLRKEYEKLNRSGIKRSFYTKKIMEIIGNVAKQKIEIQKILGDTRQLQKEINNLNGQLDRSFSIADETLFKDAKKDDQSKKAYKLLALLHSECNTIVSLVNDTGTLSREIVDLEDHIEAEKSKRTEDILKRVQNDLGQMQKESEALLGKN